MRKQDLVGTTEDETQQNQSNTRRAVDLFIMEQRTTRAHITAKGVGLLNEYVRVMQIELVEASSPDHLPMLTALVCSACGMV